MRDIYEIGYQCKLDLEVIGIKCGMINYYKINSRAKTRLGRCSGSTSNGFMIEISDVLLREDVPIAELRNTMIHELLHTCKGCMNHG